MLGYECQAQFQPDSRLSFDQHLRLGTAGAAWPGGTRFETRSFAGRTSTCINFVGGGSLQGRMGAIGVIPRNRTTHFEMEETTTQGNARETPQAFFKRADEAFDHRDAASPADSAKTLADRMTAAPMLETTTTELLTLVANQMPRRLADSRPYLAEKVADLLRSGLAH